MNKNFWKNKDVIVTGCFGFLASWLIMKLVKSGAKVVGVSQDYISESLLKLNGYENKITLAYGSITDIIAMERIFNEYDIQYCFHLAAQTIVKSGETSPLGTFESNIKGTWTVLETARKCPTIQGVIIASTDKAYGEQKQLPYREEQVLLGHFPYDASKVCAETIARTYFYTYGLPVAITRCANIFGSGDFHWSRIIPGTIRSIIFGETPVIRSDGTPLRDYLYVKDAANAYLTLAENIHRNDVRGEAFNFTAECPTKVIDLVNMIISVMKKRNLKPKVLGKGKLKTEIDRQYLSCDKAKKLLGWKAKYNLKQGLTETVKFYKEYFKRVH